MEERLQFLSELIGRNVYEIYGSQVYEHVANGFTMDSTGFYILLKDGGVMNAEMLI